MTATPATPSEDAAPKPDATGAKPARSATEKMVVWGGIALLLVLLGVQAQARFGYSRSLQQLQKRLVLEDEPGGETLMLPEAESLIVGFPTRTEAKEQHRNVVTYSWRGLLDTYRIHVAVDQRFTAGSVLGIETDAPPVEEPPEALPDSSRSPSPVMGGGPAADGAGEPGAPSGGGEQGQGGPPGGGNRPDLMSNDADGDGRVSREEAPERMAQFFDRLDANGDGYIDAEEAAAARRRREERGPGPAGGGPPGGQPEGGQPRGEQSEGESDPAADEAAPAASEAPAAASEGAADSSAAAPEAD